MSLKPVSTGRGGRGNISVQETNNQLSEADQVPMAATQQFVSTGRGGMGNIRSHSEEDTVIKASKSNTQPEQLIPIYSVGRGGVGNIKGKSEAEAEAETDKSGTRWFCC